MSNLSEHPSYFVYYDYRVDILRRRNTITATHQGVRVAETVRALLVDEQDHGLVFYFPRVDVNLALLALMPGRSSKCPWKGIASHWRSIDGEFPIAWSYKNPHPEVAQIRDYIAFYQDQVIVSVGVAPVLPHWQSSNAAS